MLTDEQIADALALIDDRYQKVITKYLQKVGKTILQIGKLNQSSINLLIQLRRMGVDVKTIERELQKVTRLTKKDIRALYERAAQEANTDARFEYVHKGVEPSSIRWMDLVENIWAQTAGAMDNLAGTTAVSQNYREIVDEAVQAVSMGVTNYNSAIRDAVKKAGRAGLQVEYASGTKRRLDSAVRQNILDGVRQVQQKAQELIGEEIGADGVDITAHPNSAPDHEPVQGRRFDLENFQLMQSARPFEDVDGNHYDGFERPITQWRCRHLVYYILIGISRRMYSDDQLKQWEERNQKGCVIDGKHYTNYEATQLMRNLETEILRQKDTAVLAKASGDDVLCRDCQSKINKLTRKYKAVAEASGLRTRFEKARVEGFKPIEKDVANDYENDIIKTEMYRKESGPRDGFKFISEERFQQLTIEARKNGATILRGDPDVEQHLDEMGASASTLGDVLMFRKDVCVSEVLEETYHFKQNLLHMNDDKGEPLRTLLNEIDAKKYILEHGALYQVPRNELEKIQKQLESYESQLTDYYTGGE